MTMLFLGNLVFALPASAQCSPVACSQILVELPYQLNFSKDHGFIDDKNAVGTGFTYVDPPASGSGYQSSKLLVSLSAGTFKITTTSGLAYLGANSQVNALGVGIDAPSQLSIIDTTVVNPPAGTGKYEQAGLWFGNDQDNYVKVVVISTPNGTLLQYLMEVNGALKSTVSSSPKTLSSSKVGLQLRVDPASRTIAASYTINGGSRVTLGSFPAPTGFFSFDAAGVDPEIGTNSFGGIFASHRNATTALTYTFDKFSVVAEQTPPPSGGFDFTRTTFPVADSPTSMVWGPDNRLYVAGVTGKVQAFTLNSAKQPTNTQTINTLTNSLGTRLLLGITVDPASTASNVILWLSHSSGSQNSGVANSGMVTRLSGSNFSTMQHVITGLPRAIANHGPNSLHFGPDGKLYIAIGGNTGAGAPNTANTEFGTRAEQPLSAAVLVADVKNSSFDGSCANTSNIYGTPPCSVKTYATGLRNVYDFVFHSNGKLYATDNGLGVDGTFPPTHTPPCTGFGDIASASSGGDNPGDQPDLLHLLQQGKYYGHPDPYRNQCVYKDGDYQNVPPLTNWVPPLLDLGFNHSTNGLIEYKSSAFCNALKGNMLATNYSVGDDITRFQLSTDGQSVLASSSLIGSFDDPLTLTQGPDGTIYVAEFGANRVAALIPVSACTQ
ncbi:MAG: PQQ-dependent sugar dehydrogenase [Gemmatimonadaceae bacterium]|nr:PQQ-dependent sugar dehydrogenase [Gloeobacterales cyanobacterium ES-bin-141]